MDSATLEKVILGSVSPSLQKDLWTVIGSALRHIGLSEGVVIRTLGSYKNMY